MAKNNHFRDVIGYKPSGVEYTEMILLVICLLLHYISWASITINGKELLSFEPFTLFGDVFCYAVFAIFLLTIAVKFVGRFSGMTLLCISHLSILVYAAYRSFLEAQAMLDEIEGLAGIANGMSGMFASFSGSTVTRDGEVIQSQSMASLYIVVAVFVAALAICMLLSWIDSICRLASKSRKELNKGYYIGILGYFLMGTIAILLFRYYFLKDGTFDSISGVMNQAGCGYAACLCLLVFMIMLTMLIVNVVVIALVELLRERSSCNMAYWSLGLAGVFLIILVVYLYSSIGSGGYALYNNLSNILEAESRQIGIWFVDFLIKCLLSLAILTCLLRTVYFGYYSTEVEKNHEEGGYNQKWYYLGGAVLVALLAGILSLFLFKGCNSTDNLLSVQKPTWEKFVMVTSENVTLYKEANSISTKLMFAMENVESDVCGMEYRWENQGKKRGYTVSDFSPAVHAVWPVLEDAGNWYKVLVYPDYAGQHIEAYINKKSCKEVVPQPITDEVLERVDKVSYRCDNVIKSGRLKGLCFSASLQEFDEEFFEMGQLVDGVLYYPGSMGVSTSRVDASGMTFRKSDESADSYVLTYGDNRTFKIDGNPVVFDTRTLSEDEAKEIFQALKNHNSRGFEAYYYFPEAEPDRLISFYYSLEAPTTAAEAVDDRPEEGVKNYSVSGDEGEAQQLMTELDEEQVFTGVENVQISIVHEEDFEGDGYNEVLISESCGDEHGCIPEVYIVYYDKDTKEFKQTNRCESYVYPEIEIWNGKTSFVQCYGLRKERYVYENFKLNQVEKVIQHVGHTLKKWTRAELFEESEDGEKEFSVDIDGDGINEIIIFGHNDSFACGNGRDMFIDNIKWEDGRSLGEEYFGLKSASTFSLLETMTNGMCDLLLDEAYLFRWNGTTYEEWEWNEDKLVRK